MYVSLELLDLSLPNLIPILWGDPKTAELAKKQDHAVKACAAAVAMQQDACDVGPKSWWLS